jgi:hypothetical protein
LGTNVSDFFYGIFPARVKLQNTVTTFTSCGVRDLLGVTSVTVKAKKNGIDASAGMLYFPPDHFY